MTKGAEVLYNFTSDKRNPNTRKVSFVLFCLCVRVRVTVCEFLFPYSSLLSGLRGRSCTYPRVSYE